MEYWSFGVSGNVGITGLAWSAIQGMHSIEEDWVLFMLNSLYIVPAKCHGHQKNEHSDAPRGHSPCPLPKSIPSTPIHLVQRPI